jgi:hypothetical protein
MKTTFFLAFLLATTAFAQKEATQDTTLNARFDGRVVTETRSNVFIVFLNGKGTRTDLLANQPIECGFVSIITNYNIDILRPEYCCKISAKTSDGKTVEKTRIGAKYGTEFNNVKKWDKKMFDMTFTNDSHPSHELPYWLPAKMNWPSIRKLPAPQELFKFDKPGTYEMEIELQFFAYPMHTSSTNAYLVKLPPVKVKVFKP